MSVTSFLLLVAITWLWLWMVPLPVALLGLLLTIWYGHSRYEDEHATSHG